MKVWKWDVSPSPAGWKAAAVVILTAAVAQLVGRFSYPFVATESYNPEPVTLTLIGLISMLVVFAFLLFGALVVLVIGELLFDIERVDHE